MVYHMPPGTPCNKIKIYLKCSADQTCQLSNRIRRMKAFKHSFLTDTIFIDSKNPQYGKNVRYIYCIIYTIETYKGGRNNNFDFFCISCN